jgi:pimeloyl-ACP methyl ester carboxylesterase
LHLFLGREVAVPESVSARLNHHRLITYAKLLGRVNWPFAKIPSGWELVQYKKHWLTGLNAGVFRRTDGSETVIAIKGVRPWDPRDLTAMALRRHFGYPRSTLKFAESTMRKWGPPITIVGHSGGGGVASWLGHKLGVPTATFNSGRTRAALLNDGTLQTNVCIRGDKWGDPWNGLYGMKLPGRYLVLDPPPNIRNRHFMRAIIAALEADATQARSSEPDSILAGR